MDNRKFGIFAVILVVVLLVIAILLPQKKEKEDNFKEELLDIDYGIEGNIAELKYDKEELNLIRTLGDNLKIVQEDIKTMKTQITNIENKIENIENKIENIENMENKFDKYFKAIFQKLKIEDKDLEK